MLIKITYDLVKLARRAARKLRSPTTTPTQQEFHRNSWQHDLYVLGSNLGRMPRKPYQN